MKVLNLEGLRYLVEKIKGSTVECARKLSNTSAIGSAIKPVYFNSSGVPVAGTYTLGAACAKGVSTSVTSGDTNLVTGDAVSSAIYNATNYEEGEWEPRLYVARLSEPEETGPWEEVSAHGKKGYYRKAGDIVVLSAYLYCKISDKSYMEIRGLPFSLDQASYTGTPKCMPIVATLQEAEVGSIGGTTGIKPIDTPVMASGASYTNIIFQKKSVSSSAVMFEAIYHTA